MKTRFPYILAAMIFLFTLVLRLAFISKGPFHGDCMSLVMQARQTAETGNIHYLHSHGFPLIAIIGGLFVRIFQLCGLSDPVFVINMMSVVFSSFAVLLLFLLARAWFDERTAFLAAILLSVTPIFLANSVYGNSHMPALFFMLLSLYQLLTGYFQDHRLRSLIMPAISLGLAIAARAQDAVLLLPIIALWFMIQPAGKDFSIQKKLGSIALFMLIALFIGALFYIPLFQQDFLVTSQRGNSLITFFKTELFDHIATDFWVFLPPCFKIILDTVTPVGVLLSACGIIFLWRERRFSDVAVLLTWFGISFYFFSSLNFYLPRFFILSLIPICILIGISCSRVLQYKGWIAIAAWGTWVLFLISFPLLQITPVLQSRHDHAYMPEFVQWVKKTIEPEALVIISDGSDFFRYYGPVKRLGRPLHLSHFSQDELLALQKNINHSLSQGISVYITSNGLYSYDPEKAFSSFMKSSYCLKLVGRRPVELWHHGALEQRVPLSGLYRIYPKTCFSKESNY